jgi:2-polyprenyl-3-methyl-5-hydroxy-6-metoxy-1,4-benzoquinol methylase
MPTTNVTIDVTQNHQRKLSGRGASCPCCGESEIKPVLAAPDRFHGRTKMYQLVRCSACELVWLQDPPSPAEMGEHYGPDYDRSVAAAGADPRHWTERRDALLKYKTSGSLLDLGCSSGGFLESIKGSAWTLNGIEMSNEVAEVARARSGAKVFVGDILDAPYAPASFDVITCFHVFEHLYQPGEVLKKVSMWLKPGGVFFTFMPNIDSAGARIFGTYWYALELPRHLYHFSPASLRNLAKSVGLSEVSLTANREVFIESSARYWLDAMAGKIGIQRRPLAQYTQPSLAFRVVRKGFRLTLLPVLNGLASLAGDGESIHAVFRKG